MSPIGSAVAVLATLGIIFAGLGTGPPPRTPAQEVETRVRQSYEAWARSDVATLDRLLADNYVDTDPTGHRHHRADWLARARQPRSVAISFAKLKVQVHGTLAEVTGANRLTAPEGETALHFHQLWVKRGTTWLRAASETTPIAIRD